MPAFRQVITSKFKDMDAKDEIMAAHQRYCDHFKAQAYDKYHCNSAKLTEDGTCVEFCALQLDAQIPADLKAIFKTYPHFADMKLMGGTESLSTVVSCTVEDQAAVEEYMSKTMVPHPNLSFNNEPIDLAAIPRQFGYA